METGVKKMELKKEIQMLDQILYILLCICSLGTVWLLRIVITRAIVCAQDRII